MADSLEFDLASTTAIEATPDVSFKIEGETLAAGVGTTDNPAESGERRHYMVVVDSMATYVDVVGGADGDVDGEGRPQDTRQFDFMVACGFRRPSDGC